MILPALSAGLTSDNPAVTLGSPLVSPGFACCHVPADRRHRTARSLTGKTPGRQCAEDVLGNTLT